MAGDTPSIILDDLLVERGRRAVLRDVSLALGIGINAVVGANGSGKSSLLRTLATVEPPAGGRLRISGLDPANRRGLRSIRQDLGYLPQQWDLPAGTRVIDALRHGAWLHRCVDPPAAIDAISAELELRDQWNTRLAQLSGGTRRRVAIAQSALHRPRVLLLDEPTAGLDVGQRAVLWAWLRAHASAAVVVIVTHDLDEVVAHADRAVVVSGGGARAWPVEDRNQIAAVLS